jgi:hypothetical protein
MPPATNPAAADPAEPLLTLMTPHARTLAQQLRALVKDLVPQSVEHVHMGWEVITFGSTAKMGDAFAAIAFRPTYVNLQFMDAHDLPDPDHHLEGTGKRMRHVKVHTEEEARAPELPALVRAAAKRRGL